MRFCEVILPLPLYKTFTYAIPDSVEVKPSLRVRVPFGKQKLVGLIGESHDRPPPRPAKAIEAILDTEPLFPLSYEEWLKWASQYYLTALGEVFSTALPAPLFSPKIADKIFLKKSRGSSLDGHWDNPKDITFTTEQKNVFEALISEARQPKPAPALLFGVTGSGKTEIFLRLIQTLLAEGKQALYLVPEIGLTPQVIARFKGHFGKALGLYHSGLTENQRLKEWLAFANGEPRVVVGTRSAVFLPATKLGLMVVDEEQDSSYKQEERFRYHARDLAIARGKKENFLVLLGSATPAFETYKNACEGKYKLHLLRDRPGGATTPQIILVDMAAQKRQTRSPLNLSKELFAALESNLKKGEQSFLLLNRRGYARSCFCLECEQAVMCPNCSVNLVFHKKDKKLLCHYCDETMELPKLCPSCNAASLTLIGTGTEGIEEEIKTYFSKARMARLDRDTTQKKGMLLQTLKDLAEHKIDLLVGTQMIAKGHDLPRVTLVGVLGIDAGLGLPDFRASERIFQLLMQVSGRAGRGDLPGRVIVQSFSPNHDSIQKAVTQDYEGFFQLEMQNRKELGYPPFGRLVQFQFSSASEKKLVDWCRALETWLTEQKLNHDSHPQILGPAPSALEKIRGRFRWHLLLKDDHLMRLKECAFRILKILDQKTPAGIKWAVDVDPISML